MSSSLEDPCELCLITAACKVPCDRFIEFADEVSGKKMGESYAVKLLQNIFKFKDGLLFDNDNYRGRFQKWIRLRRI